MQLNLFQNIANEMKKIEITTFMEEISERLKQMEEELVIDRFEGDVAICEDRKTGEKKEIRKEQLEEGMREGSVIKKENGRYVQMKERQKEIQERIEEKIKQIWK